MLANHRMVTRLAAGLKPREFRAEGGINKYPALKGHPVGSARATAPLEGLMLRAPADPPHPKTRLVTGIHDPAHVARLAEQTRALCRDEPAAADAVFVSLFLREAGFPIPVTRGGEELVLRLMVGGWKVRRGPGAALSAGDVYVLSGADGKPAKLGLAGKVALDGSWCYALDCRAAPPYRPTRRALTGETAVPHSYHLHFG